MSQGEKKIEAEGRSRQLLRGCLSLCLLLCAAACPAAEGQQAEDIGLTAEEKAWIKQHPVIRVAQDPFYAPFEFHDKKGVPVGIAVDYLGIIEKRTGLRFKFFPELSWAETYKRLEEGTIDIAETLSPTPEREKFLVFSKPMATGTPVIWTRLDVPYIHSVPELKGKRVAIVYPNFFWDFLKRDYPDMKFEKVNTSPDGLRLLSKGKVDAFFENMLVTQYYIRELGIDNVKISGRLPYEAAPQRIGIRRELEPLRGIVDKVLDSVPPQEKDQIFNRWVFSLHTEKPLDVYLAGKILICIALVLIVFFCWHFQLRREVQRRKAAEETLKENEHTSRLLFDEYPAASLLLDPATGNILRASKVALTFFGYPENELIGKNINLIRVEDTTPAYLQHVKPDGSGEDSFHFETRCRTKDKGIRMVDVYGNRLQQNGRWYVHLLLNDKTVFTRIAASNERFMAAVMQADDGIAIVDDKGFISFINPAYAAIFKEKREDLIGLHYAELRNPNQSDESFKNMISEIAAGHMWKGIMRYRRKDGSVCTIEVVLTPNHDAQGNFTKGFISCIRDISEQTKLSDELQFSQKLESVGKLAGGVAHDFNNNLQVILGHVEMALDQLPKNDPTRQDLEDIRKATRHSADLTLQLLTFARKQENSPQVMDINTATDELVPVIQKMVGETIHVAWQPQKDVWPIKIDPAQFKQLIMNLASNARDATTGNGVFTLSTERKTITTEEIAKHPLWHAGEFSVISFADTGSGIPSDVLLHIFDPFFTTKKQGKGTGLGLATVYGVVKQNGGFITVDSVVGRGTTFHLHLPRYVESAAAEPVAAAPAQEPAPVSAPAATPAPKISQPTADKRVTVLIVEDDSLILTMTKRTLEHLGYTVLTALTPSSAESLCSPLVSLLITDAMLPEMTGRELATRLKAQFPKLKILYMSGYADSVFKKGDPNEEGGDLSLYFLQKPFSTKELADKVRQVLSAGQNA